MPCYTPLKGYKNPTTGGLTFVKTGTAQSMQVACGSCLGCRLDHALMWACRIVHESHLYMDQYGNSFVTLTYREAYDCTEEQFQAGHYIPADFSLRPQDVSKFIRRLRKSTDHKIRYFYCGEYGDENQRPHYHICLFNHSFNDKLLWKDDEGFYTYTSHELELLWPFGFATVQALGYGQAAYTARYSLKKITGQKADDHYLRCDQDGVAYWLLPEYIRMSTGRSKPCGLGAGFYAKFSDDIFPSDETPVPGHGIIKKVPRYYQNILETEDPETLKLVKELRQIYIKNHGDDFTPARLRDRHQCAKARTKKRTL